MAKLVYWEIEHSSGGKTVIIQTIIIYTVYEQKRTVLWKTDKKSVF